MSLDLSSSDERPLFQDLVAVLNDEDCRTILSVLDEPMTVSTIASQADLPLSTTYKKLDRLTDVALVTETAGVHHGSHHKSRYIVDFDRLSIALDSDREFQVEIDRSDRHSFDVWSTIDGEC